MTWMLLVGDCVPVMADMDAASVDSVVTDPPYGLGFMGKEWDDASRLASIPPSARRDPHLGAWPGGKGPSATAFDGLAFQRWCTTWASEALRVLKPGGHLLSFGGTRTYHRLVCALEDAGFEIRDCLAWLYGSGFPKSLDVSKAIDKAAGAAREVRLDPRWAEKYPNGPKGNTGRGAAFDGKGLGRREEPITTSDAATPDAERWQGWGTALKPAFEPIVLARKPLSGTVAENVLRHGVGALNVDGTRIGTSGGGNVCPGGGLCECETDGRAYSPTKHPVRREGEFGRWPANVLLDADAAAALDEQSGPAGSNSMVSGPPAEDGFLGGIGHNGHHDTRASGGASRFFYTAKTSRSERENGVAQYGESPEVGTHRYGAGIGEGLDPMAPAVGRNNHPTVKPVDLMQWLCRLVTPPQGVILDPFTGSGSTGIAALREGFSFIGIEREPDYVEIARARIIGDAPLFNVGAEA